jgi:hypothetical protein
MLFDKLGTSQQKGKPVREIIENREEMHTKKSVICRLLKKLES